MSSNNTSTVKWHRRCATNSYSAVTRVLWCTPAVLKKSLEMCQKWFKFDLSGRKQLMSGGPRREFFQLLTHEIFKSDLFVGFQQMAVGSQGPGKTLTVPWWLQRSWPLQSQRSQWPGIAVRYALPMITSHRSAWDEQTSPSHDLSGKSEAFRARGHPHWTSEICCQRNVHLRVLQIWPHPHPSLPMVGGVWCARLTLNEVNLQNGLSGAWAVRCRHLAWRLWRPSPQADIPWTSYNVHVWGARGSVSDFTKVCS